MYNPGVIFVTADQFSWWIIGILDCVQRVLSFLGWSWLRSVAEILSRRLKLPNAYLVGSRNHERIYHGIDFSAQIGIFTFTFTNHVIIISLKMLLMTVTKFRTKVNGGEDMYNPNPDFSGDTVLRSSTTYAEWDIHSFITADRVPCDGVRFTA